MTSHEDSAGAASPDAVERKWETCPTCPCCHVDTCIDYGCHMAPSKRGAR